MQVKKITQKNACSRCFLTEDDKDGKDTDQNISARSLTLLCGGVGIVG